MKPLSIFAISSVIILGVLMGLSSLVDDNSSNHNSKMINAKTIEDCKIINEGNKLATAICIKNLIDVIPNTSTSSDEYENISSDTELLFKLPDEMRPYTEISKLQGKEYNPPKKLTAEEIEAQEKEWQEILDEYEREYYAKKLWKDYEE